MEGGQRAAQSQGMALAVEMLGSDPSAAGAVKSGVYQNEDTAIPFARSGTDPWELADRLWAAWGNR